jgi:hypothetical protein
MADGAAPSLLVPEKPALVVVPDLGKDLGGYIEKYLKIRTKKDEIKKRHKEELRPYNDMIEMLENGFLRHLNDTKTDNSSVKGIGTLYRSTKRSATIADAAAFRRHVIGAEDWDLVDWRANAPQVHAFIEKNETIPPGVNFSVVSEVNVRKA